MSGQKPEASWPITQMLMPAILGCLARSDASLAATAVAPAHGARVGLCRSFRRAGPSSLVLHAAPGIM